MSLVARPASGYASLAYAESLAAFGRVRALPRCDGWLLERAIPGTPDRDAMGPYPLFCCRDWSRLRTDLDGLGRDLVSVVLVADPLGPDPALLRRTFDHVRPYKEHLVVDSTVEPGATATKHHRYYARRALRSIVVEPCDRPIDHLDTWVMLYRHLAERHGLRGIQAFSREAFARQLAVPGIWMLRALHEGRPVAAQLWYLQGAVAYNHLVAVSPEGYECFATYALYWEALHRLHAMPTIDVAHLGSGAGDRAAAGDGLAAFKRGWSRATRTAHLCGHVVDPERYEALRRRSGAPEATSYFPSYRASEGAT